MNVLGVKISEVTRPEALEEASRFLVSIGQHKIFTPNPEMLVKAQKDDYFKEVLNSGDLNLCDGFGLWLAAKGKVGRVTGVDFMIDLCQLAGKMGKSVYLLGSGSDEVVRKTAEKLQNLFPKLIIAGYDRGPDIDESRILNLESRFGNQNSRFQIPDSKPDILFVAFGMGKQEKWIYENLAKLPSVKIAMGVGGAFDYISGIVPRAPRLLRKIGLEWLYRLFVQPSRCWRIFNATFRFTYLIIRGG